MIRLRVPIRDDLHLYRIVVKRLLPKARIAEPKLKLNKKETYLRLKKAKVFVSSRAGRPPFGFISLVLKQNVLFIDLLAVEASDVNRGWGGRLLMVGERYGKRKGCIYARLFVDQDNKHAIEFYQNKGYEIQEYVPLVHCYLMQKPL